MENEKVAPSTLSGYWWCENCQEEVSEFKVTYDECHDKFGCYRPVVWRRRKADE